MDNDLLVEMRLATESLDRLGDAQRRHNTALDAEMAKVWEDVAELREYVLALGNRLENLTIAVTTSPAEVAAAIVNDANRGTLREVRGDDAS
jgi:hypothetical protein